MAEASTPAVWPVVFYRDPLAALKWLERAFGFETSMLITDDTGALGHAEMTWRGATIGIGGEWASEALLGPARMMSPASLAGACSQFIQVDVGTDIDGHCERAKGAGARITQAPADQFYGARTYRALDLEGHVWNFRLPLAELSLQDMEDAGGVSIRTKL